MSQIQIIERQILEFKNKLAIHEIYDLLNDIEDIKVFMEMHVYAVWDFMSLVKALQKELTCISLPWKPSDNPKTSRFINEIVLGEESDVNENGVPKSHFEMYLEAMIEVGANTSRISDLVNSVDTLDDISKKITIADLQHAEKEFLEFTFSVIQTNQAHKIAAAFTFGREDLIPDMFIEIIKKANQGQRNKYPKLTYYLNRHIELDGDEHGPLSLEMVSELCGNNEDKWNDVLEISIEALKKRMDLWNAIANEIKFKRGE